MTGLVGFLVAVALVGVLWGAAFWAIGRTRAWYRPAPRDGGGE